MALMRKMRAPHTYTTEDTVEINCHGGVFVVKKVLETALQPQPLNHSLFSGAISGVPGRNHDMAVRFDTFAAGYNIFVILQSRMNHSSFVRIHRFRRDWDRSHQRRAGGCDRRTDFSYALW